MGGPGHAHGHVFRDVRTTPRGERYRHDDGHPVAGAGQGSRYAHRLLQQHGRSGFPEGVVERDPTVGPLLRLRHGGRHPLRDSLPGVHVQQRGQWRTHLHDRHEGRRWRPRGRYSDRNGGAHVYEFYGRPRAYILRFCVRPRRTSGEGAVPGPREPARPHPCPADRHHWPSHVPGEQRRLVLRFRSYSAARPRLPGAQRHHFPVP